MVGIRRFWNAFKNIALLFSFIVNMVLLIIVLTLVSAIFDIKTAVAEPILNGLYSSFVGLNEADIITTINVTDTIQVNDQINVKDTITVSDTIPVRLNIPLAQNTTVVLTDNVPIQANASFALPGGGGTIRGSVSITLPQGLQLPVALNLNVPVDSPLPIELKVPVDLKVPVNLNVPVNLKVPVNIPLDQTQLNDVSLSLKNVIDPIVRVLTNLPDNWSEMWVFMGRILAGQPIDLLADNEFTRDPWPGFRTGPGADLPTFTPQPTATLPPNATVVVAPFGGEGTPGEATAIAPQGQTQPPAVPPTATVPPIPPTATALPPTPTLFIPTAPSGN
ncbi:MAG: hypothetical protein OHK0023_08300 [Anaerolineae bacterium]